MQLLIFSENIKAVQDLCDEPIEDLVGLCPPNVLDQIYDVLSLVDRCDRVMFLESTTLPLFLPYVHVSSDKVILVLNISECIVLTSTDVYYYKDHKQVAGLRLDAKEAIHIHAAVINVAKSSVYLYGLMQSSNPVYAEFFREVSKLLDVHASYEPVFEDVKQLPERDRKLFNTYTLTARDGTAIGEVYKSGTDYTVVANHGVTYLAFSGDASDCAPRYLVPMLAWYCGIVLEETTVYTMHGLQVFPRRIGIPTFGSFVFK